MPFNWDLKRKWRGYERWIEAKASLGAQETSPLYREHLSHCHLYWKGVAEETLLGLTEMLPDLVLDIEAVLRCSNHSLLGWPAKACSTNQSRFLSLIFQAVQGVIHLLKRERINTHSQLILETSGKGVGRPVCERASVQLVDKD